MVRLSCLSQTRVVAFLRGLIARIGVFMLALAAPAFAQEMDPNMPGMDHSKMGYGLAAASGDQGCAVIQPGYLDDENGIEHADKLNCNAASGSGTARLPGNEGGMHGIHIMPGDNWMIMLHGNVSTQFSTATGPRGDEKIYATSMAMLSAVKDTSWGRIEGRAMMSLEPLMKHDGYPNLFASGENAYGNPLIDRQHPHDLFMELSARADFNLARDMRLFLYGGPVGEPALGPSAFMHRASAKYNPVPPITHHWFDSTHISYGVVTAGIAAPHWQVEASAFRGREPDERRFNIETPKLDSWSVRATWSPSARWAMALSHGYLKSPEELEPTVNEHRTIASVHYSTGKISAMAAFSSKNRSVGPVLTAWLAEANWDVTAHHSLFARFENVKNDELFPNPASALHGQPFRVSKFQLGYAWNTPIGSGPIRLSLGGSLSAFAKPVALDTAYGRNPMGYTLFARFSLGH